MSNTTLEKEKKHFALARRRKIETKDGTRYGAADGAVFTLDPKIAGRADMVTVTLEKAGEIERKASAQRVAKHRREAMEKMQDNIEQSKSDLLLVDGDILLSQMEDEDGPTDDDRTIESMIEGDGDGDENGDEAAGGGVEPKEESPPVPEADGLDNLDNSELREIAKSEFDYKFPGNTHAMKMVAWIRDARKA